MLTETVTFTLRQVTSASYAIDGDGLILAAGGSAVIQTSGKVGLPCNIFGLLTGKGKLIFQGVFISSGKIDPGYRDHLRVGIYNGGSHSIVLKKGTPLCCCCFFQLESGTEYLQQRTSIQPSLPLKRMTTVRRLANFYRKYWINLWTIVLLSPAAYSEIV